MVLRNVYYSKTNLVDKDNPVAILYYWYYSVESSTSRVRDPADELWHGLGWVLPLGFEAVRSSLHLGSTQP